MGTRPAELNAGRHDLTAAASSLYPDLPRAGEQPGLTFGQGAYFDGVNVGETLALAAQWPGLA